MRWRWLIPLFLLTFWLGARGLNADSIWADELYSIRDAGGPFFGPLTPAQIWERVATGNPWHTPGFFLLLNGWSQLVGWQPPALRALSLLIGLLAVAWVYRLGADTLSPRAGLYAALIVGTSAFYIHYLHEIRMYTLIVLLTTFTLWSYLRIMSPPLPHSDEEGSKGRGFFLAWVGLFVGAAGILYTHYLAALLLAAIGVYHLFLPLTPRPLLPHKRGAWGKPSPPTPLPEGEGSIFWRWWGVVGVMAAAGVVFLPWARVLISGLNRTAQDVGTQARALSAGEIVSQVVTLFGNGSPALVVIACMLVAFMLVSRDDARVVRRQRTRRSASLLAFLTLLSLGLILLANALLGIIPASRIRYLLALWTLLALLVGHGIATLQGLRTRQVLPLQKIAAPALLGIWMGLGIWRSGDPTLTADVRDSWFVFPMHTLAAKLRVEAQPGDLIAAYLPDDTHPWVYYTTLDIANVYFNGLAANYRLSMTLPDAQQRRDEFALMTGALSDRQRVWTAYMPPDPPIALTDLQSIMTDEGFALCRTAIHQPDLRLDLFTRSPVCCDADAALIRYPHGITLTGIVPLPSEVEGALPVLIGWSLDAETPPYTYSVALHVLDADGELAAQTDYGLPFYSHRCEPTTLDVSPLAPGEYTLAVIVYDWETGARLQGTLVTTGAQGERIPLGAFTVR